MMRFFKTITSKLRDRDKDDLKGVGDQFDQDLKRGQAQLSQQLSTIIENLKEEHARNAELLSSKYDLIEKVVTVLDLKKGQAQLSQQLSTIIKNLKEEQARNDELLSSNHDLIEKVVTVLNGIDTRLDKLEKLQSQEQRSKFVKALLPVLDSLSWTIEAITRQASSAEDTENESSRSVYPESELKTEPGRVGSLASVKMSRKIRRRYYLNRHLKKRSGFTKRLLERPKEKTLSEELNSWLEGVRMVQDRALDVLSGFNVRRLPCEGEFFNPNFHKAVGVEEGLDIEDNKIIREELPGYILDNRVIRYAEVVVGKRVSEPERQKEKEKVVEPQKEREEDAAQLTDKKAIWPTQLNKELQLPTPIPRATDKRATWPPSRYPDH
ncbi:MAG: nucleotide exchange factor GrpE [bacterium]|nr:nucleotide exchange factor GrpE [bacterium]